jgi:hypothetical protein
VVSKKLTIDDIISGIGSLRFGGWLEGRDRFEKNQARLRKGLEALDFKMNQDSKFPLVVTFQGGTGTGKSSVFNALIGEAVSRTGVERPQTRGSIFFIPSGASSLIADSKPFSAFFTKTIAMENLTSPAEGLPGSILLVTHSRGDWNDMMLIDSPDLDSVEVANRALAEEIMLVSDLVVFVTSQEKYADHTPFHFIKEACRDHKPFILVMNKLDSQGGLEDLRHKLEEFGLNPQQEILGLPRIHKDAPLIFDSAQIAPLNKMLRSLDAASTLSQSRSSLAKGCRRRLRETADELVREAGLHKRLRETFQTLMAGARKRMLQKLKEGLDAQSEKEIRSHIRSLLSKYDFMRKPRRLVRSIILFPLTFMRMGEKKDKGKGALPERFTPREVHLDPLLEGHAWFQQSLARFMGEEDSLRVLYSRMAQEGLFYSPDELRERYGQAQKEIDSWLHVQFDDLKKGLSAPKKFGLYSASLLTGVFLAAVESVTFGGFTFFEIMMDTVIAPFIPRGVLELFIYDKLREIARELDMRHRDALTAILDDQRNRLGKFLETNMTGSRDMAFIQEAQKWFEKST